MCLNLLHNLLFKRRAILYTDSQFLVCNNFCLYRNNKTTFSTDLNGHSNGKLPMSMRFILNKKLQVLLNKKYQVLP